MHYIKDIEPFHYLKYGTVPIVMNVSEFSDNVIPFSSKDNSGNGFIIKSYSSKEITSKFKKIYSLFNKEKIWKTIQKNGMNEEFLWSNNAKKYAQLYSTALKSKK